MSANFEIASLEGLGAHVFKGSVAATYLAKQGLPANTLDNGDWAKDSRADKVDPNASLLSYLSYLSF
jgi:hypothetical protein